MVKIKISWWPLLTCGAAHSKLKETEERTAERGRQGLLPFIQVYRAI